MPASQFGGENRLKGDATPQELQALAAFYSESETHAG